MNRRKFLQDTLIGSAGLSGLVAPWQGGGVSRPAPAEGGASLKSHWLAKGSHLFHDVLEEGTGFSFSYQGQGPISTTSPRWQVSTQTTAGSVETTFRHSSGLTAIRRVRAYPEFDALEYTITFKNEGPSTLPFLGPVNALDLKFGKKALIGAQVVSSGGGLYDTTYPPEAYAIRKHWIGPMTPLDGQITLTTEGGRSSNRDLPFFFVQNDRESEGIFVAIGWTGQWSSTIAGDFSENVLHLVGGIPDLHIRLKPGEAIGGPRVLIGCYRGELSSGSNRLRRLIRNHFTPLLEGKSFDPILTYDHWWNIDVRFDESLLRRLADAAAEIGQEYFLLDAGWYVGSDGPENFSGGVGNWEEVDRKKFPSGLASFANYVRSKGMKFGLWFEPERVRRGTLLATQHPDWVLWLPGNATQNPDFANPNYGLLDYSRPEVQEWVRNMLDGYIRELDIRYIRHDFNIDPLHYWDGNDTEDRRGITQIRHIEGFYQVIDWIREHHPATVLEGCASGGRRVDLETASRFHTFWISDQTVDPDIVRFHLEGMNYFLPGNYGYVCYTLPLPIQKQFQATDFGFQSFFGGALGTGGRIDEWPASTKDQARRHISVYKSIRKFLVKDYYLLTPQPRDVYAWEAWQFHDPEADEGFVQVFRVESAEESKHLALKALDPRASYQFSDPYSGKMFQMSGAIVISEGLEFRAPKMSSQILTYARMNGST
jgi:alpha-galactosidase